MLLRQLEYFVSLATERHFARAAAKCHVSQPALSEAIRKLEHELRVPLVRRSKRFEGLTPEGERLVLWARRILADRDALRHEVAALQTGLTGELRLGVIPAAACTVTALSDPFSVAHPLVRMHLKTSLRSAEIVEHLRRFELDAGIIYPDRHDTADLVLTPMYREQQVLVASSDLPMGQTGVVDWADVAELPICLLAEGMRGRQLIDDALSRRGLRITPRLETDSFVALLAHVKTGRWATIVPHTWVQGGPPPGTVTLPLREPLPTAQVVLATRAVQPSSMLIAALLRIAANADFSSVGGTPPAG